MRRQSEETQSQSQTQRKGTHNQNGLPRSLARSSLNTSLVIEQASERMNCFSRLVHNVGLASALFSLAVRYGEWQGHRSLLNRCVQFSAQSLDDRAVAPGGTAPGTTTLQTLLAAATEHGLQPGCEFLAAKTDAELQLGGVAALCVCLVYALLRLLLKCCAGKLARASAAGALSVVRVEKREKTAKEAQQELDQLAEGKKSPALRSSSPSRASTSAAETSGNRNTSASSAPPSTPAPTAAALTRRTLFFEVELERAVAGQKWGFSVECGDHAVSNDWIVAKVEPNSPAGKGRSPAKIGDESGGDSSGGGGENLRLREGDLIFALNGRTTQLAAVLAATGERRLKVSVVRTEYDQGKVVIYT